MVSVSFWGWSEVLLCGIDSHKCPSNFETIGTIGAPLDLSLNIDWTDSELNPYTKFQIRMVSVPQRREPDLLATPVLTNGDLYSGGHRLNAT